MTALSLEDRFALEDLIADYAWALDTGDADALAGCFTTDCRLTEEVFEDADIWEGRDGIRAMAVHYFDAPGFPGRQHHVSQIRYRPADDGSVAITSFAFVTECHGEPPYELRFCGWYEDVAVRNGARWLFRTRAIRLWDGAVLQRFPGKGEWVPRKRPVSLMRR